MWVWGNTMLLCWRISKVMYLYVANQSIRVVTQRLCVRMVANSISNYHSEE